MMETQLTISKGRLQQKIIVEKLHQTIGGVCYICCQKMSETEITKDHVFPKSMGYGISFNMMPAHFECNRNKENRTPNKWEIEISMYAYDKIGLEFFPKQMHSIIPDEMKTKPMQFYVKQLRAA